MEDRRSQRWQCGECKVKGNTSWVAVGGFEENYPILLAAMEADHRKQSPDCPLHFDEHPAPAGLANAEGSD